MFINENFYFTLLIILSFTNLIKANEKDQTINILQKGGNLIFIRHAYAPGGEIQKILISKIVIPKEI